LRCWRSRLADSLEAAAVMAHHLVRLFDCTSRRRPSFLGKAPALDAAPFA
jgi:hypothetical protein